MNNSTQHNVTFTLVRVAAASREELLACYICKYILGLTGGVTNFFLITVVCLQTSSISAGVKWLVVQYSFAYFCITLIMYPVRDTMIMGTQFKFKVPLSDYCPHFATVNTMCWALANWTEVCLALNRLVAICFPHQYGYMKSSKAIVGSLLFAWGMSFLVVLPATYAWPGRIESKAAIAQCSILQSGAASQFVTSWETFVPYSLAGIMSALILLKAALMNRKRKVSEARTVDRKQHKTHTRRMTLAFMLVASFVWNCICNMPFLVITMGFSYMYPRHPSLSLWVRLLRNVQVALSPVVFFLFNEEYRRTGRRLIKKCFGLRHVEQIPSTCGGDTTMHSKGPEDHGPLSVTSHKER